MQQTTDHKLIIFVYGIFFELSFFSLIIGMSFDAKSVRLNIQLVVKIRNIFSIQRIIMSIDKFFRERILTSNVWFDIYLVIDIGQYEI